MARFFYRLLVLWTVLSCGSQPAMCQSPAGGPQNSTVAFELFHDYLIVLHGTAGPLTGLNFLLDTGATPSVLDPSLAAKLRLASVPTEIAVLQGTTSGATATLPSLQIGPISCRSLPVLIKDLSFVQKVLPVHLDGIVGLDVLGQAAFVIDYASRTIKFGPDDLADFVPLQISHGLAMLSTIVNQKPAQLLLDTGAPSLILFRPKGSSNAHAGPVSSGSIGEHSQTTLRLTSLAVGPATIHHPTAYVVPSESDPDLDFAGVLSPTGLGFRRVSIDLPRGRMAFSLKP